MHTEIIWTGTVAELCAAVWPEMSVHLDCDRNGNRCYSGTTIPLRPVPMDAIVTVNAHGTIGDTIGGWVMDRIGGGLGARQMRALTK